MADLTDLNGKAVSSKPKAVLTLEMELTTGKLAIGGELANLDLALNMLAQATRYIESKYRNQQLMLFQAEVQRNQQLMSRVMQ